MLSSIDVSRAGMLANQNYVNVTAHNIGNAALTDFKAVLAFTEVGEPAAGEVRPERRNGLLSANERADDQRAVDLPEQFTNMLAAQRGFQLNSSAFRMAEEMLRFVSQMPNGG